MSGPALGVVLPTSGAAATREHVFAVADAAEELGFRSVWAFQRLLYALESKNQHVFLRGTTGGWPKIFERVLDPLQVLAMVAARTSRVRLGTCVINLPYYTPVVLAKELTTLDVMSGGRVDLGAGIGWSSDELAAVGVPTAGRGRRGDEFIRCLRTIWNDDVVAFDGEFYRVPPSRIEPKPIQRPGPPVLVGGYSEAGLRRAVQHGDGYIVGAVPLDKAAELLARLAELRAEAGRTGPFRIATRIDVPLGPPGEERPPGAVIDQLRSDLVRYGELGATDIYLDHNQAVAAAPDERTGRAVIDRVLAVLEAVAPVSAPTGAG